MGGKVLLYSDLLNELPEMRNAPVESVTDSLIYVYTSEELREYGEAHPGQGSLELRELYKYAEGESANPVLILVPVNQGGC